MFASNVKFLSTTRYLDGGFSNGNYANFNLADYTGDDTNVVKKNRALLKEQYQLPSKPKWLKQTHSDICLDAKNINNNCGDASITKEKGVVCAILTADCLPIFASNKDISQVGMAHAGWQGIINGVIESFVSRFSTKNLDIHFGAAISQKAFEVDYDVYIKFINKDKLLANAFIKNDKKYYLDIYKVATIILNNLGIKNITGGKECTYTQEDKYFSYRRDGANSGRMAHLIWLE